ncbi:hypothetical protein DFQ27_001677 [Actinomortierella ambigua]|uniref:GH18 domain-containing protein n=1 Tax=Actinomortierella ambigua TaxID=1343610 RepID=A0A9P6U803_9FUNG|nr:hypothetical protein DFQ26_005775 [Actinomortierella ambigua]KAG0263578.1 hypothetical protein DFQ27_001677 [Actinomortierella ambigua]
MKVSILSLAIATFAVVSAAPTKRQAASNKYVVGYYVPWGNVPVADLDFTKVTHINYGFGILTTASADPTTIGFDRTIDGVPAKQLVQRGNAEGVKILISIGGWAGGQTFSTIAADAALRAKFINNALLFVRKNTLPANVDPNGYGMDGVDLDWEYPGRQGAVCNVVSPNDSANYLLLLKELRTALNTEFPNSHKLLTAAVRIQPFDGPNGAPLASVADFVQYFDFIMIMAYDLMGGWSATTGPNAPLVAHPHGDSVSYTSGMNAWLSAGWPKNKLIMGTPFYGRSTTATVDMDNSWPRSIIAPKTKVVPKGGPSDTNVPNAVCNEGAVYSGIWSYKEIRQNILTANATGPAPGWTRHWDDITKTPYLFRQSDKTFISYDDAASLAAKVQLAKTEGLLGVMYWDMTNDYNNELLTVLNQIHSGPVSKCDGVASWNPTTVYAAKDTKVVHAGRLFTNKWWTQGETPSTANSWGVWTDKGAC